MKGGRPLFVAYHEGGWTLGGLEDEEMDCRMFAREFGGVAVNVEYRYVVFIVHFGGFGTFKGELI